MSKRNRFLSLLLLSLTSVFFAEVISGSMKFPLYDLWGWMVVVPLYGLHTIILLYIITRYSKDKRILFSTLYFAGILFGLYEAYLTKVLWVGLSDEPVMIFNLSSMDFIVLVFWWHPIFAFIIPSIIFETFMTNSNSIYEGLSEKYKNRISSKSIRIILFIIIGLFLSFNSIDFTQTLLSGFTTAIPIILLYYYLRKKGIHKEYSLTDILPSKLLFTILTFVTLLMYIIMGLFIDGHVLTFYNQLSIWVLYIIFGLLFYYKLRKNSKEVTILLPKRLIDLKHMIFYMVIIVLSGSIFSILFTLLGIHLLVNVIIWILWILIGIYLLVRNLLFQN